MGILVITHYQRILNYIHPDVVHIFLDGRIVKTGGRPAWWTSWRSTGTSGSAGRWA